MNMDIKAALAKIEQLNFELIEAGSSKEITALTQEIFALEQELELSTGKNIEELQSEYA
jgi:hypothetical protein